MNISQSSISNYEKNVTSPDIETLKKFSDYFGVSVQDIISEGTYAFYNHKNKGETNNLIINQLSEKVYEQFERRIASVEEENIRLHKENERLLVMLERFFLKE